MNQDKNTYTATVILKNTGNNIIQYIVPNCSAERFKSMEEAFQNARKKNGGIVELWSDGKDFGLGDTVFLYINTQHNGEFSIVSVAAEDILSIGR